jgi:hypothetical protein
LPGIELPRKDFKSVHFPLPCFIDRLSDLLVLVYKALSKRA